MTDHGLTDLLQRATEPFDPSSADRIIADSIHGGARRRRRRHLAVTATAGVAAAAVAGLGVLLAGGGDTVRGEDPLATQPGSPTSAPADGPTSYDPGSETEVPGGPEIPTDRGIVGDARLVAAVQELLASSGTVTGAEVEHVSTGVTGHLADTTREGRRIDLLLDGMGTSITIQRWDGYSAVGVADPGPNSEEDPGQRVATTAQEACAGAYRVFPPVECTSVAGGAYEAGWPSQGAGTPDTYKELVVTLFTDDGWAIQVDTYNTPGEKAGVPLRELPPLSAARALEIAQSPRWFTEG
ncbi:hypothetical protein CFH99_24905 [Nocardioides aromaticivorans]|uniref:Uncharacterized protein n=1 Tax=Nocardioides aromaticivorans TaxID=200618 RepID=A0ABX7PS80_9ACTN|nr:hypothetical protein [Nocardioides aromaticivorans]QSR28865.1 hypothetical protein CFH99_24905 [Nocardioides aromaticivorans]